MNISRAVVTDLWPLYLSGEASADTRALVEDFLRQDPELARLLEEDKSRELLAAAPTPLRPDHEMQTFTKTRKALFLSDFHWLLFLALMFSCFAFGRIVSDTSWDVSPRNFIVVASTAVVFWIAFLVRYVKRLAALR